MYRGRGSDLMQLTRIGCFALLAGMLATWISAEAVAKSRVRLHHAQGSLNDVHAIQPANGSGQLRYQGGPKSPMWHSPN